MSEERKRWINKVTNHCLKKPGQHIIITGTTGTGKTQTIFHIIKKLREAAPQEYILVFDIGKSGEVLRLADFGLLRFLIPFGKTIEIDYSTKEMEEKYRPLIEQPIEFDSYEHLFHLLSLDHINIVCIKPFHRKNDTYAKEVSTFFEVLIELASNKTLKQSSKLPLSIVLDEMHWVAPGQGSSLNDTHTEAGKDVQMNIDTLRSMKVRIIGSTQMWTKLRRGVRDAFPWIWIRRGASFNPTEEPKLSRFNSVWESLEDNVVRIVEPKRDFSEDIELPYYGEGEDIGDIYYLTPTSPLDATTDREGSAPLHA